MDNKVITDHLPEGWKIVLEKRNYYSGCSEYAPFFYLYKNDVLIATGRDGIDYYRLYHSYDWEITHYVIEDVKPIVDVIMDNYRLSLKLEQDELQSKLKIESDERQNEYDDKVRKEVCDLLGLPFDVVVLEKEVTVENKRSWFSNLFTWSDK